MHTWRMSSKSRTANFFISDTFEGKWRIVPQPNVDIWWYLDQQRLVNLGLPGRVLEHTSYQVPELICLFHYQLHRGDEQDVWGASSILQARTHAWDWRPAYWMGWMWYRVAQQRHSSVRKSVSAQWTNMILTLVGTPENSLRCPSTATPVIGLAKS